MAVPDFQSFMLPLLKFAADGREHSQREAKDALSRHFNITESDRREMLPSGRISYQIYLNPINGSPRCIQATPALRGPEHYRAFSRARRPQKKNSLYGSVLAVM